MRYLFDKTPVFSGKDGIAAINFALDEIDDHYDRREFLEGWLHGDTSEWPEFKPDLLPVWRFKWMLIKSAISSKFGW